MLDCLPSLKLAGSVKSNCTIQRFSSFLFLLILASHSAAFNSGLSYCSMAQDAWQPVAWVGIKSGYGGSGYATELRSSPEQVCEDLNSIHAQEGVAIQLDSYTQNSTVQYLCRMYINGEEETSYIGWPKPIAKVCQNSDSAKLDPSWVAPLNANSFDGLCRCPAAGLQLDPASGWCKPSFRPACGNPSTGSCTNSGNPIEILTGNKHEEVTEYRGKGSNPLIFKRTYNSVASGWSFGVNNILPANINGLSDLNSVVLVRPEGKAVSYTRNAANFWVPANGQALVLKGGWKEGWIVEHPNGTREYYLENGHPSETHFGNGDSHIYEYSDNTEQPWFGDDITITHSNGDQIVLTTVEFSELTISEANIMRFSEVNGRTIHYQYGGTPKNLVGAIYDEGQGESYSVQYLYENPDFPNNLTGVIDANGHRYVQWQYDSVGRAKLSRRFLVPCQSQDLDQCTETERTEFDYTYINDASDPRITVTNPLGKNTTYHYIDVNHVKKSVMVEGHQSANCAASNQYTTYYDNGLVQTKTDWSGNVTWYLRDDKGRVVKETKGLRWENDIPQYGLSADITKLVVLEETSGTETCWHALYQKKARIINVDSVRTNTFDNQGRITSSSLEVRSATNENCDYLQAADLDGDGLDDAWEQQYFGTVNGNQNVAYSFGAEDDNDGDGLTNLQEFQLGGDPTKRDGDDDGMDDGWEFSQFGTLNENSQADYDNDGLTNLYEFILGTDPTDAGETATIKNLALEKSATQSSDYDSTMTASVAVDGEVEINMTHTLLDSEAWWEVDLGSVSTIFTIELMNRIDCCQSRLSNVYIFVSNQPYLSEELDATLSQEGVTSYFISGQVAENHFFEVGQAGRYVRVQLASEDYLSLREVVIHGVDPNDLDGDFLPDSWEQAHFSSLGVSGEDDSDSDGLDNLAEYQLGINPVDGNSDTDNDSLPDGWEWQYFGHLNSDITLDEDQDDLDNRGEYLLGTDPTDANSNANRNIALGKSAWQSSNWSMEYSASLAVDDGESSLITHTLNDANAWLEIDLERVSFIKDVVLFNRTDCCSDRLSNVYVFVSDVPFENKDLNNTLNQPEVTAYFIPGQVNSIHALDINHSGRFIRIQLQATDYLSLKEVNVIGYVLDDLDSDAILDQWEFQYFGELAQSPGGDFDVDGITNLTEFKTGTDPTDANSGTALHNIALGKPVSQSSTYSSNYGANIAVDGVVENIFTHTLFDTQAWWQIDLQSVQYISSIELFNRLNCCQSRLSDVFVLVSNTPFQSQDLESTFNQPGVSNYYISGAASLQELLNINRTGRYLRVQLAGENFLSLREVVIMGAPLQ